MRQTRITRLTRLAPVQRLPQVVEDVRRWFGLDHKEAIEVLAHGHSDSVKQAEKIAPVVKETPGQKLRREIERIRIRQQHSQRRSGGMHV